MFKLASSMIVLIFLIGCAGSPVRTGWEAEKNRKSMFHLQVGMSKNDVLNLLGEPRKTEAYSIADKNIEFWLYMTEGKGSDRKLNDSNFTPLAFENERLIGWGRNFYDQTLKYEHKIKIN